MILALDLQWFAEENGAQTTDAPGTEETPEKAAPDEGGTQRDGGNEPEQTEEQAPVSDGSAAEQDSAGSDGDAGDDRLEKLRSLRALEETFEEFRLSGEIRKTVGRWEKEAEELRQTYPGFDLGEQIRDPGFTALLRAGIPVRRAYETMNLETIMASAMHYAAQTAGKKAAEELARQNARPRENSVLDRAASIRRTDVHSLTEKDILRILGEVSRGAKISFK